MSAVESYPKDTYNVAFKPYQNIPESRKNEEWCKHNIDWCISMSPIWWRQRTDYYYDLYNGKHDQSKWESITKTYGVEFPVGKIKHIPLIRPMINRLLSEQEERPFNFTTHTEDTDSVTQKIQEISKKLLEDILEVVKGEENVEDKMLKLQKYYKEEFQSDLEVGVHHAVVSYMLKHRMDRKLSEAFLDRLITGKQAYRVKINRIGEDPEFEVHKPGSIFHADNNTKWIKDCDWAIKVDELTPTEILDKYGDRMNSDDIKIVEDWLDMYHKDAFFKMSSLDSADQMLEADVVEGNNYVNANVNHKIAVYSCEWKSIRRVMYVENENKYSPDAPFIKIISEEKLQELKEGKQFKKLKQVKYRYIQDRWEGVRIGDSIYVDLGKSKYPIRSMACPSKVALSFNGLTYNGKIKPYSLLGETEDLQDLYNILHFHKENLIALSGVRGSYMDLSQIPDFKTGSFAGNLKMFMYYKKMGTAFIDRSKEHADKQFNQFPTYDETLGSSTSVVLSMIEHVEATAERITGVSRQAMGTIGQYDGKGNTENAIMQSSLVTEYLFNEHDEFAQQALTDLANSLRVAYKDGYTGYYVSDQHTKEIFTLRPEFALCDLNIFFTNRASDKQSIAELKMYANQLAQQQLLQFEDILPLFKKGSLTDIIRYIEANIIKRRKQMEEQQAQLGNAQAQLEQAKGQAEVAKLQAEIAKLQADMADNQRKLALEEREVTDKKMVETEKVRLDQERVKLEQKQLDNAIAGSKANNAEVKNN